MILDTPSTFSAANGFDSRGTLSRQIVPLVQELAGNENLELVVFCTIEDFKPPKTARKYVRVDCKIDIQLYGPFDFFEELGFWLEENNEYLQDPHILGKEARYCNPHRLSFAGLHACPMVSQVVSRVSQKILLRDVSDENDFLDNYFSSELELEETKQPECVTTLLKRCVNHPGGI